MRGWGEGWERGRVQEGAVEHLSSPDELFHRPWLELKLANPFLSLLLVHRAQLHHARLARQVMMQVLVLRVGVATRPRLVWVRVLLGGAWWWCASPASSRRARGRSSARQSSRRRARRAGALLLLPLLRLGMGGRLKLARLRAVHEACACQSQHKTRTSNKKRSHACRPTRPHLPRPPPSPHNH